MSKQDTDIRKTKAELVKELRELQAKYLAVAAELRDSVKDRHALATRLEQDGIELRAQEEAEGVADEFLEEIRYDTLGYDAAESVEIYLACRRAAYAYFMRRSKATGAKNHTEKVGI